MAKAKSQLILGRRKKYPLHLELEVYKGADCRVFISTGIVLESEKQWDNARQLIIKCSNAGQYNKFLRQMIVELEDSSEKHGVEVTPDASNLQQKVRLRKARTCSRSSTDISTRRRTLSRVRRKPITNS